MELGYHLSSEEHGPSDLAALGREAERAGFSFAAISDHIFPWLENQGHSPHVWTVLGALADTTERIGLGTGVSCPILRQHPLLVAHAAATVATMAGDRFFLGVGTGERLNEHVLGQHWPTGSIRQEMLEEAVDLIRELWEGDLVTRHGRHFTVENARIYDAPVSPPPIYVAAAGAGSARLAGSIGDGLISLAPDEEMVEEFRKGGGDGKPAYALFHCCVAEDRERGLKTARQWWGNTAVPGSLNAELPLPRFFEDAAGEISDEVLDESLLVGDDPDLHLETIERYRSAGFDHVWVHQVGPDQRALFDLYSRDILPEVSSP